MNPTALTEQFTLLWQNNPYMICAAAAGLLLLAIFKRKTFFRLLALLLFIGGVYLVVSQFGKSLDTGIRNTEEMTTKTQKALE